jgi:hypothetical protein
MNAEPAELEIRNPKLEIRPAATARQRGENKFKRMVKIEYGAGKAATGALTTDGHGCYRRQQS